MDYIDFAGPALESEGARYAQDFSSGPYSYGSITFVSCQDSLFEFLKLFRYFRRALLRELSMKNLVPENGLQLRDKEKRGMGKPDACR